MGKTFFLLRLDVDVCFVSLTTKSSQITPYSLLITQPPRSTCFANRPT
jgi:hypothetical protein